MPELVAPTVRLHAAWLAARDDWGPGVHEDGFGLRPDDEVDSPAGFAAWVTRLTGAADPAAPLAESSEPATSAAGRAAPDAAGRGRSVYWWIVEGDRVLGGIALRDGPDDVVRRIGHIGYGIRPSARRHGLATWALSRMLDQAHGLGLDPVLVVCAEDNLASVRTIERCGGVLDDVQDTELGRVRRYRFALR